MSKAYIALRDKFRLVILSLKFSYVHLIRDRLGLELNSVKTTVSAKASALMCQGSTTDFCGPNASFHNRYASVQARMPP